MTSRRQPVAPEHQEHVTGNRAVVETEEKMTHPATSPVHIEASRTVCRPRHGSGLPPSMESEGGWMIGRAVLILYFVLFGISLAID